MRANGTRSDFFSESRSLTTLRLCLRSISFVFRLVFNESLCCFDMNKANVSQVEIRFVRRPLKDDVSIHRVLIAVNARPYISPSSLCKDGAIHSAITCQWPGGSSAKALPPFFFPLRCVCSAGWIYFKCPVKKHPSVKHILWLVLRCWIFVFYVKKNPVCCCHPHPLAGVVVWNSFLCAHLNTRVAKGKGTMQTPFKILMHWSLELNGPCIGLVYNADQPGYILPIYSPSCIRKVLALAHYSYLLWRTKRNVQLFSGCLRIMARDYVCVR